jgi:FlaA1/EpsC-like NDP-sugar epimerase
MADRYFIDRFPSKWIIVTIDTVIVLISFFLTRLLMNDFSLKTLVQVDILYQLPLLMAAYCAGFTIFKPYNALSGLTGLRDISVIFSSVFTGALLIFISNLIIKNCISDKIYFFSMSVILINVAVTLYMMTLSRLIVRYILNIVHKELIKKPSDQSYQLRKDSLSKYPVELLVFNALN